MKQQILAVATLSLLALNGCASTDSGVAKPMTATTLKTNQAGTKADDLSKPKTVVNAIVAIVNDDVITLYDLNSETQSAVAAAEKKGNLTETDRNQLKRTVLDRLIEKKLTDQKIRELNIKVSDEEIRQAVDDVRKQNKFTTQDELVSALSAQGLTYAQYQTQLREQIEKLKLVSIEVRSKVQVGETEMREYYAANIAKYTGEESYRARHIFFKTGEKATKDEIEHSKATALSVLADAKRGLDFAELAKKFSEDPAARKDGGDLGSFKKGDMQPELEKSILVLKPGEVSDLVTTPIGFHIIKLEAIVPGEVKPFESVKAEIEEYLYRKKSEERFSQWAAELRSKASIEIKNMDGL